MRFPNVLKPKHPGWFRFVAASGHCSAMVWSGTSDRGKLGLPNTKLPKKLKWTPLDIYSRGLKSGTGSSPPRKPARQARPPRRSVSAWLIPNAFTVKAPETLSQSDTADVLRGLNQGMRNDLSAEFTQALRARYPVEIRREAVNKLF
jgi:hypothetical protein